MQAVNCSNDSQRRLYDITDTRLTLLQKHLIRVKILAFNTIIAWLSRLDYAVQDNMLVGHSGNRTQMVCKSIF